MFRDLATRLGSTTDYLRAFEHALSHEAKRQGLDEVICGHIHNPAMKQTDGVLYCNDGDWVEHQSALVEKLSGELRLVTWQEIVLKSDRASLCEYLAQATL